MAPFLFVWTSAPCSQHGSMAVVARKPALWPEQRLMLHRP